MNHRDFTDEECGAVLAGLRLLQATLTSEPNSLPMAVIEELYTDSGRFPGMSVEEIDSLCERISLTED